MTNTEIIVNLATIIADQRLEISELKTETDTSTQRRPQIQTVRGSEGDNDQRRGKSKTRPNSKGL